ncbi:MAG: ATP-binding protein [Saprospiraceae bacterium]|nr:ATP-binding protein [Saprospiraceae bacterium]
MKIALSGAHGTGKSTLANFLRDEMVKMNKVAMVTPEIPRMICETVNDKEYFRRGKNSLLKQLLILIGQLVFEEQYRSNIEIQICDRTLIDHWAYTLSIFGSEIKEGNFTEIYEEFISQHCKSYDKIFYIPIEFNPVDDGLREQDEIFSVRD